MCAAAAPGSSMDNEASGNLLVGVLGLLGGVVLAAGAVGVFYPCYWAVAAGAAGLVASGAVYAVLWPRRRDEWVPLGLAGAGAFYSFVFTLLAIMGALHSGGAGVPAVPSGDRVLEALAGLVSVLTRGSLYCYGLLGPVLAMAGYTVHRGMRVLPRRSLLCIWFGVVALLLGLPVLSGLFLLAAWLLGRGGGGGRGDPVLLLPAYLAMMLLPAYVLAAVARLAEAAGLGVAASPLSMVAELLWTASVYAAVTALYDRCFMGNGCGEASLLDYVSGDTVLAAILVGVGATAALATIMFFAVLTFAAFHALIPKAILLTGSLTVSMWAVMTLYNTGQLVLLQRINRFRRRGVIRFDLIDALLYGASAAAKPTLILAAAILAGLAAAMQGQVLLGAIVLALAAAHAYRVNLRKIYHIAAAEPERRIPEISETPSITPAIRPVV